MIYGLIGTMIRRDEEGKKGDDDLAGKVRIKSNIIRLRLTINCQLSTLAKLRRENNYEKRGLEHRAGARTLVLHLSFNILPPHPCTHLFIEDSYFF